MGNTTTRIINTSSEVKIKSPDYHLVHKEHGAKICLQQTEMNGSPSQISWIGEIFVDTDIDIKKTTKRRLSESDKITIRVDIPLKADGQTLNLAEYSTPGNCFHGLGHVTFRSRSRKQCAAVQLCLEDLHIVGDIAYGTYHGFMDKTFYMDGSPNEDLNEIDVDLCVTFMLTLTKLQI